jgi:hypothetical protein
MYPTYVLQRWHRGIWNEIGWRASTPKSHRDLEKHGADLAAHGGLYRLVRLSPHIGGDPDVVYVYPVLAGAS